MIHFRKERETKIPSAQQNAIATQTQCNSSVSRSQVLLLTCSAYASGLGDKAKINKLVRILCDNGSERSWCTKSLADHLKLKAITEERLSVFSFGSVKPNEKIYEVVELKLTSMYNPDQFIKIEVLVADTITAAPISVPNQDVRNRMRSRGLVLADCCESDMNIEMLIGADVFWQIIESPSFERIDQTITCVPTIFGFALQGNQKASVKNAVSTNFCVTAPDVQVLWDLEVLGIKEKEELNVIDKALIDQFERNLKFVNGRYETDLLWKSSYDELGNNYLLAKKQFDELIKGFSKNNWVANEYKEIIRDQLDKGIVEYCVRNANEYFMPHRAVVRADKDTTKVRVVFNCSSKTKQGISLNDCLETGPNLNPNILDVILNFRKFKVAFSADIEKAFLMIGISEENRKFLKFLWLSDKENEKCKVVRMTRLPFGCKSSPFILSATIKSHIKKYKDINPESFEMLDSSLYVDDLYYGADSVEKAFELSCSAVLILKDGGFNLRKLKSNSSELRSMWIKKGLCDSGREDERVLKVLGLNWDPVKDILSLDVGTLLNSFDNLRNTKRWVLRAAAMIFDPLGIITPFVVRIKCLLQEIWERGIDWDDELPSDISLNWSCWCSDIKKLKDISIERKVLSEFGNPSKGKVEVHIFCDASPKAYGAVVYFRYVDNAGEVKVSLVMSKGRVAPLKKLTLPRLELMAAVIGTRVGKYLRGLFKDLIREIMFWSDSSIVIYWIKGCAKRWKQFVSNRVLEVQEGSDPKSWFHCRSEDNPADLITRGVPVHNLIENEKWWLGPIWLRKSSECWPKQLVVESPEINSAEVLKEKKSDLVRSFVVNLELVEQLWSKFSVWSKLQRVVAWCLRFIRNVRGDRISSPYLETNELKESHDIIIKLAQRSDFNSEITTLEKEKVIKNSNLISLNPYLDSYGLLRVGGRLKNANLPETVKHPLLLSKNHPVTKLLVRFYHLTYLHGGVQLINSEMKQKYWITGAKSTIRREVRKCTICTRFRSEFSKQIMADLPFARVNPGRAFLKCGTDFAGPFSISLRRGRGVKPTKMYVCVFVCFTTKAIHLELVNDLSAPACIGALKRFIARRGKPIEIYSDCGTNYIGAKNYLKACSMETVGNYLANESVKWIMNVPSAPHFGGLWEAAVKSMKFHMKRVIGSQILSQEEFCTNLAEIEAVLNSRPLVAASEDPNDFSIITPGHFLIGSELKGVPEPDLLSEKITIRERWKLVTQISQSFWKSWSKDYLTQLQVRNKWKVPTEDLCVNDLVLIKDDNLPPLTWKMARVIRTYKGTDDKVRAVNLKTISGELKRPIHKLVKLPVYDN